MAKVPLPTDKHVGSRVRMRRLMLGLSQEKLAVGLKLTFQQVQKYEKGANRIGASRLQQIANILKVPVAFFFEEQPGAKRQDGSPALPEYIGDVLATTDGIAMVKAFAKIESAKLRRVIVHLCEEITGE